MTDADLRDQIVATVLDAVDGEFTAEDLELCGGSLRDAGMSSLAFLVFIEELEIRFGVVIPPDVDPELLLTVDAVCGYVAGQRSKTVAGA